MIQKRQIKMTNKLHPRGKKSTASGIGGVILNSIVDSDDNKEQKENDK